MPSQLIYTSAARLLDSPLSGYGVVARSEKMPGDLVRLLIELSEFKEPADQGILGPQFSYRVEGCNSGLHHIFTSVRDAGADYSKRSCHIAHHLILTENEMRALCQGAHRTTPAGILLSLELRRFWASRWQREPEFLEEGSIPPLWENMLTENAPTWLVFTGKNENALAFCTPPYHQGCLAIVPQKTQSRDILRLLHESCSHAPMLGWGIALCTYSVETDALESSRRLFTTEGSALHQRAQRSSFPTLHIRPGLEISPPMSAAPTKPISLPQETPAAAEPAASGVPQLSSLPTMQEYHYRENCSNDIFEHPWRKEKKRMPRAAALTACLSVSALLAIIVLLLVLNTRSPEQPTPQPTPPPAEPSVAPADADVPAPAPEEPAPLPEVISPEEPAPAEPQPPADEPKDTPPADTSDTPDNTEAIVEAKLADLARQQSLEDLEVIDPEIIVVGKLLPPALLASLPRAPGAETRLEQGECIVHIADAKSGSYNGAPQKLRLASGRKALVIHCVSETEYLLILPNKKQITMKLEGSELAGLSSGGNAAVSIRLPIVPEKGKLMPVLLLPQIELPLNAAAEQTKLPEMPERAMLPTFDRATLKLEHKRTPLDHKAYSAAQKALADEESKRSWTERLERNIKLNDASRKLTLPQLGYRNEAVLTKSASGEEYACELRSKDAEIRIHIKQRANTVEEVCRKFENFAYRVHKPEPPKEPVKQEPKKRQKDEPREAPKEKPKPPSKLLSYRYTTMADAWYIIAELCRKNSDAKFDNYTMLYRNDVLGKKLCEIFRDNLSFMTLDVPNDEREWTARKTRVKKLLLHGTEKEQNRYNLRNKLEEYFTHVLRECLKATRREFNEKKMPEHYLKLISTEKGENNSLIWTFEFTHEKAQ